MDLKSFVLSVKYEGSEVQILKGLKSFVLIQIRDVLEVRILKDLWMRLLEVRILKGLGRMRTPSMR